jgi:diamine N-acetyltransferase
MSVHLQPVTLKNWQACIHLQVGDDQAGLLATNLYSLAEAYVQPECQPRAVYDGHVMIGFGMYLHEPVEQVFWIPRFMIDRRFQGQGYGRAGMLAMLEEMADLRPDAAVMLSITPANTGARALYDSIGFEDTGRQSHGELIIRRPPA